MKKASAIIAGAVALLMTTLLYLLLGNSFFWMPMFWISFAAVMVLEFAAALLVALAKGDPRRVAAAVGALMGALAVVLATVVFINLLPDLFGLYCAVLVLILGSVVIEGVFLVGHSFVMEQRQAQLDSSRAYFESCRNVVTALIHSSQGQPHSEALRALEEDLRYADDTKLTDLDGGIREMLTDLSNGLQTPGYDPAMVLSELRDLICQRQKILHH